MANFYYNNLDYSWYADSGYTVPADVSTITVGDAVFGNLASESFAGNFTGVDFSNVASMVASSFVGANLTNAILPSDISYVDFTNATLIGANFSNVTEATGANFSGINFNGSLTAGNFIGYYIAGVLTTLPETGTGSWEGIHYRQGVATTLEDFGGEGWGYWMGDFYANDELNNSFTGLDAGNTYYVNSQATTLNGDGCGFWNNKPYWYGSGSNLDYADFSYQDLSTVDFSDVRSVVGANFWGSTLNNIGIGHNSETGPQSTVPAYLLEGANFAYGVIKNCAIANNTTGTSYVGVRFENCSISGDFSNTYMEDCSFISCQIYQADFSGGVFVNATFQSSQISDTNFFGANLGSVYFLSNVFSGSTDFTGASYEGYQGPQINTDGVVSYEDWGNGLPGNAGLNSTIGFAYTGTDYNWYHYWMNGEITTLDGGASGDWNGSHYRYGEIFTDGFDDNNFVYYVGGQATSLDSGGNGLHDGVPYYNGSEQPTGYNAYFYYIDNVETTLDANGTGLWNDIPYSNGGIYANGYWEATGIYYIDNQATTLDSGGNGTFSGKLYSDGSLFTGEFEGSNYISGVLQDGGGGGGNSSAVIIQGNAKFYGNVKFGI